MSQELSSYPESQNISYEARCFIFCVPVTGNLRCVLLAEYRIENRLVRQTRWKTSKP
jgi:hypothetical protein